MGSGRCLGVLRGSTSAAVGAVGGVNPNCGHTDAVACLELIPAPAPAAVGGVTAPGDVSGAEAYIASGGGDGEVKLWRTNGEFVQSWSNGAFVTALKFFQDTYGGEYHCLLSLPAVNADIVLYCIVLQQFCSISLTHSHSLKFIFYSWLHCQVRGC